MPTAERQGFKRRVRLESGITNPPSSVEPTTCRCRVARDARRSSPNYAARFEQGFYVIDRAGHPDNSFGAAPLLKLPLLQRGCVFARTLHLDFNAPASDTRGDVRHTAIVRRSVCLLCVATWQTVNVLENRFHNRGFSWCLHGRYSTKGVDKVKSSRYCERDMTRDQPLQRRILAESHGYRLAHLSRHKSRELTLQTESPPRCDSGPINTEWDFE